MKLSKPAKASIAYSFASFFSKGIGVITLPIFTRLMPTNEIGVVTTFTSWQTIISVIATLSLNSGSFNVAMLDFKEERDQYESAILFLSTLSSLILLLIYICAMSFWSCLLGLSKGSLLIMLISFIFTPAMDYWLARQRYEYNYKGTAIISISATIVTAVWSILCVLFASYNEYTELGDVRIAAMTSVQIAFGVFFYISIFRNGKTFVNRKFWIFALKMNLPLIIHTLSKHVLDVSDRIMISNMVGDSAAGIYGTLYSISSLSLVVWTAINASLIPYMFEKIKDAQYSAISKVINPLFLIYAIITFLLTLISPEIVRLLATEEYYEAIYMMPAVAAGIFFTAIYNVFGNVLLYYKKTVCIMASTIVAATLNIVLNYIFIPKYGYIAAAYTTLLAYVVLSVLQFVFVKISVKEKLFNGKYILLISGLTAVLILTCNLLYKMNNLIRFFILVVFIALGVVFWRKILSLFKFLRKK